MNPELFDSRQRQINRQLLAWAGLSIAAGLLLRRHAVADRRAFAVQQAAWGAIDGAIALGGAASARRNPPATAAEAGAQAGRLRRLLWINAGLDVGYVAAGAWLSRRRGAAAGNHALRGHGLGVLLQGGFLLLFDTVHALRLGAALRRESR